MLIRALALACSAWCALSAADREWNKQYTVSGKPELVVRVDDGGVDIRPGTSNSVEARIVVKGWQIGPNGVRIDERQSGDRIDLEVRTPKINWHDVEGGRSVRLELRVPASLRADIKTGDGAIVVNNVGGEMRFRTGDGNIDATGVDGAVDAETGDGTIRLRGRFDALRAKTGDGSVDCEVARGSRMASQWEIRTGDGSVTMRLPDGFAADLDADTGDGKVTVDLPLTVTGQLRESGARGKLNGGGPALLVHTGDGSVRIARL